MAGRRPRDGFSNLIPAFAKNVSPSPFCDGNFLCFFFLHGSAAGVFRRLKTKMDGKSCHDARGKRPHFLSPRLQKQIVPRQRKNSVRECGACSLSPNGRGALPATTVKGNYTAHVAIGPVFPIPILTGRRKGQACVGVAFLCSEAKRIWLRLCKIPSIRHRGGRRENPF